jgi:hypothetical protein
MGISIRRIHLLDSLLGSKYTCSSTLNNSILFAGSVVKSFPRVKAVACLPLCCMGATCNNYKPKRAMVAGIVSDAVKYPQTLLILRSMG